MTYFVKSIFGPKGRQVGYLVCSEIGEVVATFRNKDYGHHWRTAADAAKAECNCLNGYLT